MEPDRTASDALGTPGEPVAEVDPHDLKTFWVESRNLRANHAGQSVGITFEAVRTMCKPGVNPQAVWYRSTMIWVLTRFAQNRMSAWLVNGDVSDAVFQTLATIPMEWWAQGPRRSPF